MIYNGQTRINQVSPAFKLIIRHLLGAIAIICSGRERVKPKLPLLERAAKFFFWLFFCFRLRSRNSFVILISIELVKVLIVYPQHIFVALSKFYNHRVSLLLTAVTTPCNLFRNALHLHWFNFRKCQKYLLSQSFVIGSVPQIFSKY